MGNQGQINMPGYTTHAPIDSIMKALQTADDVFGIGTGAIRQKLMQSEIDKNTSETGLTPMRQALLESETGKNTASTTQAQQQTMQAKAAYERQQRLANQQGTQADYNWAAMERGYGIPNPKSNNAIPATAPDQSTQPGNAAPPATPVSAPAPAPGTVMASTQDNPQDILNAVRQTSAQPPSALHTFKANVMTAPPSGSSANPYTQLISNLSGQGISASPELAAKQQEFNIKSQELAQKNQEMNLSQQKSDREVIGKAKTEAEPLRKQLDAYNNIADYIKSGNITAQGLSLIRTGQVGAELARYNPALSEALLNPSISSSALNTGYKAITGRMAPDELKQISDFVNLKQQQLLGQINASNSDNARTYATPQLSGVQLLTKLQSSKDKINPLEVEAFPSRENPLVNHLYVQQGDGSYRDSYNPQGKPYSAKEVKDLKDMIAKHGETGAQIGQAGSNAFMGAVGLAINGKNAIARKLKSIFGKDNSADLGSEGLEAAAAE